MPVSLQQPISMTPQFRIRWLLPALLVLLTGILLYRSPYSASNLDVVPDTVEYAVGAQRLALFGHYTIVLNGVAYPPRYPLWFPAFVLAPVYFFFPGDLGNGILAILACAIVAALAAYGIGMRLAGEWGGVLAAIAVVADTVFAFSARQIMTEVPFVAFGLAGCWLFLRMVERAAWRDYALAGLVTAGAFAMRSEGIATLLPFLALAVRRRERLVTNALALLLPTALLLAATLLYNRLTFGEWRRTGYHFWCSVPYDYPNLVFSLRYVRGNLDSLATLPLAATLAMGIVGLVILAARRVAGWRAALIYLLLAAVPISLFHLFYFAVGPRFHLLGVALLRVLGGAGLAVLLPAAWKRRDWPLPALTACLALIVCPLVRLEKPDPFPLRREVAQSMGQATPDDAILITAIDPVYMEPMALRGTHRQVLPLSREIEYASKLVTPRRVPHPEPPPRLFLDARLPALMRAGAHDACPLTADEALANGQLAAWIREGKPVYLDSSLATAGLPAWKQIVHTFHLAPISGFDWLARLEPR